MLSAAVAIARKEMTDHLRDVRSLIAAALYALMGPAVVGLVSMADAVKSGPSTNVLAGMISVFTLVSAFVGGMNVAMDLVAGERERRSLLPLLLNPIRREDVVLGKWAAVAAFALAGLVVCVAGFAAVFGRRVTQGLPMLALGLLPLPLLAASLQLLISTVCRATKEAQTYLSLAVFLPMGLGLFLVFFPVGSRWCGLLPIAGQQLLLEAAWKGQAVPAATVVALSSLTAILALLILLVTAAEFERDEIIYGD